ncbi:leucine-rich repeat domain-containing protein [bacterium]|nr:leucine-rich repeat domain-containing protein [bacterium]
MSEYFVENRTMSVLADQARRISGGTNVLNGAEILETLSKVQGSVAEGSKYIVKAVGADNETIIKSGTYDKGMIFALPTPLDFDFNFDIDNCTFREWIAPVDTTGNFITVEHPTTAAPSYMVDADIAIKVHVKENNAQVTLDYHNYPKTIDWGDGVIEERSGGVPTHIYSISGRYDIKIYGGRNDIYQVHEDTSGLYEFNSISINGETIPTVSLGVLCDIPNLYDITLGYGVTEIAYDSSDNTKAQLQHVILPSTIKTIGQFAFANSSLNNIILPYGLETIGTGAFNNTNIRSVVIPETVTTCCNFYDCSNLRTVIVKTGSINAFPCFQNCTYLENIVITYNGGVIPNNMGTGILSNSGINNLYVPDELVSSYKSALNWSFLDNYIKPLSEYTE